MKSLITISFLLLGLNFNIVAQNKPLVSNEVSAKIIKVYPIPATTVVNFEFQKGYDKSISIEVYNFMGKKIVDIKNPIPRTILFLNEFYRGLYIFQLRDRNGRVIESGRFQVIK